MIKKLFLAVIAVSILVGTIVYIKFGQFTAMGDAAAKMIFPPETVTAITAESKEWEQVIEATASVAAVQGVTVSAEVDGRVTEIAFESGATVESGQILLQMDTSSEDSQLASARAAANLAKSELKRLQKLVKKNLTSDDEVDRAEAHVKETIAQMGVINALINKKTVKAPFAGRLGIRRVDLGQILSVGDPLVALQKLNPVYVDFSIPQQKLSQLKNDMTVRVSTDAAQGKQFSGKITAINLEVDPITRNVQVRAQVDNPAETLRSGMFVNVELLLPETRRVLPVPATAILFAPFGNSVFVIDAKQNDESGDEERVLRQQFVKLGEARGDFVDITEGLKPGEQVVTSGVFKLRSGAKVVIDNALSPEFSLVPKPADS